MEAVMKKGMIKQLIGLVCIGLAFSASATTWTYKKTGSGTSTAGVITNEQWTITVKSFDEENAVLSIGIGNCAITSRVEPTDTAQSGILDLRELQVIKGEDAANPIIVKSVVLSQSAFNTSKFGLKELYCDIISSMGSSCFGNNTDLIKIEVGGDAEEFPTLLINKCTNLETAAFNFPNIKKAGDGAQTIVGVNLTALKNKFDISTFANPGITNVLKNAFATSYFYGDLTLTNVMSLGTYAFSGAALTNVYLSGPLTTLPQYVLRGNGTITNVVLDLPKLETIDKEAFGHASAAPQKMIRRVELVSPLKDMGQVTNIVVFAANSTASLGENGYLVYDEAQKKNIWQPNNLCIYVSKKQWTPKKEDKWSTDNPSGFVDVDVSNLSDKEKKLLDEETLKNVTGVLITKSGTKTIRKAFIIHKASIYDKKQGFAISIR